MPSYALLPSRGVLAVTGEDRVPFLQGLTSNDVAAVSADRAQFSTFLTPQGKFLHDFFVIAQGDTLLLDCEADRRDDLMRRLKMYRLRSKAELRDATGDYAVAVIIGKKAPALLGLGEAKRGAATGFAGGVAYIDPRLAGLGVRAVLPRTDADNALSEAGATAGDADLYDRHRLALGVPEGKGDLIVEKSTLLESNYDALNAISWDKGCYLGQELTARMKYRGLVKKRLMPVSVHGPLPEAGTVITLDGRDVGEMRSGNGDLAIALLRLDAATQAAESSGSQLVADGATIVVRDTAWTQLPPPSDR